ncbi:MAG: MOP flippase family protein [Candidatus Marinimicrobia bacterium]|nr:MOP flippase family protein [Candidatus Neomarinimicrobiota bacterium]
MTLKQQAISGVKWSGVSMGVMTSLQFVTLAVLARLLSPSDFGLMGMIMVVIGFAQAFADMGLSNAIIHRQDVTENILSSLFWINVVTGLIIFFCILLVRPLVVIYFKEDNLSNYLVLAAFIFLLTPIGQIFTTLLRKELKFKTLSKIEITGSAVYSASTIGLALAKFGVLSLIFGQLIRSLSTVIILFFIFRKIWLPRFHFSIKEIKSYLSFGAFQMGERVVNYLSANIDYIIIGRFLGPSALGFYTLAYNLMIFPLTKINPIITKVAFPAFSKVQNDNAILRRGYCKAINYISILSFPMLAGMLVVAPEFIRSVYGAKWEPSIIVLQIFCLVGAFKSLGNPIGSILLAKGRPDIGLYWNVFVVIVVSFAVIGGANWGINGVAAAILFTQAPLFLIIQPIVNRLIDLKFSQYLNAIKLPFVCSVIMLVWISSLRIIISDIDTIMLLVISIISGGIIYFITYYMKDKTIFVELKSILKGN